jgi:hypothetical protein
MLLAGMKSRGGTQQDVFSWMVVTVSALKEQSTALEQC